jgi:hypothetical protein
LSVDAKQRLVLEGYVDNGKGGKQRMVCTEPSPDALVAQAAQLAASANVPINGNTVGAKFAGSVAEQAGSIGVRTETIQVLRDGYFRLCEAALNGLIRKEEYQATLSFIDEFIVTVVAIEALGGKVVATPILLKPNSSINNGDQSQQLDSNKQEAPVVGSINVTGPATAEQANAIKSILDHYYIRKAAYQALIARLNRNDAGLIYTKLSKDLISTEQP